MANSVNVPLSEILRSKSATLGDDEEPKKKSREDWRKAKELEEARKAGTAPAAVDEEGKDINPHIPQYISSAPWYFGSSGPTLKHQRVQEEKLKEFSKIDEWYKRGVDPNFKPKKFRPGACENCGAMTHKKKDCMERPRKFGAVFTGVQIAPDEYVQPSLSLDFDGKRDRWAGYDPSMHQAIIDEFHKVEDAKRKLRAEKLNTSDDGQTEDRADDEDEEDEDKYVDDFDMPGTKVDSKQRITVRNLRIREDTAKYLRNLDPDSAYYDPKTRAMRDNPHVNSEDTDFKGENFVRYTGDTVRHAQSQKFAWEAYDKGVDVHILAEPTKLEMLQKVYETKKEEFKANVRDSVLERYGGAEHLDAPPKELLLAQTEQYVEYSRYGKVVKGAERVPVKSKYEEDLHPGNHTSIFGSFWRDGQWGYKCCYAFIKNAYCTGEAGKAAAETATPADTTTTSLTTPTPIPTAETNNKKSASDKSSSSSSSSDNELSKELEKELHKKLKKKRLKKKLKKELKKQRKLEKKKEKDTFENQLKEALKKEDQNIKKGELMRTMDERKRKYTSMYDVKEPTEAEMEAYLMKRQREDDPMAQFIKK